MLRFGRFSRSLLALALASWTVQLSSSSRQARFIVRFHAYRPAAQHVATLACALGPPTRPGERLSGDGKTGTAPWTTVGERKQAALRLPTDFIVVAFARSAAPAIVAALKANEPAVRDVSRDSMHRSPLAWTDLAPANRTRLGSDGRLLRNEHARSFAFPLDGGRQRPGGGRRLQHGAAEPGNPPKGVQTALEGRPLWDAGYSGQGVRVAVFDTGLGANHPHFRQVKERINWTNERQLHDQIGHGTFVAGVITGQHHDCPGWAPDAELFVFRVFTNKQISYTSWFLDAFNYAMWLEIDVLNLSIGGPDHGDRPFIDKVWELSANNVIVVSAIGNDGPLHGTLNNPADQLDTIGVGGVTGSGQVAKFSSRGMTTWELPFGYGRWKPDVTAQGQNVLGSKINQGCRALSGTSVASPVVAGAAALLLSIEPDRQARRTRLSPAAVKQALLSSAVRHPGSHAFEQGAGRLNVTKAWELLARVPAGASAFPPSLDLTDCPYMWPYCTQPLYAGALPVVANLTLLNPRHVSSRVTATRFVPAEPVVQSHLAVRCEVPRVVWPWSGFLAVFFTVAPSAADFDGVVRGVLEVELSSVDAALNEGAGDAVQVIRVPVTVRVVPTPPRSKRVLWDQFHSVHYPSGYFPRDDLKVTNDMLDWNGDHPHTNFRDAYTALRGAGYFVEVLTTDLTCFDAHDYGVLLMVDSEEEFFEQEVLKLERDVREAGLSVIVLADWYSDASLKAARFFDDNTRSWWEAVTGGSNVPALNDLLAPFGIALSGHVWEGTWGRGKDVSIQYQSGTSLAQFPAGGWLAHAPGLKERTDSKLRGGTVRLPRGPAVLGALDVCQTPTGCSGGGSSGKGHKVVVYGDASCLDSWGSGPLCGKLLAALLDFSLTGRRHPTLLPDADRLSEPFRSAESLPRRRPSNELYKYSSVLRPGARAGDSCGWYLHRSREA